MKGILWYVTRKLEGIFDGILMEFRMRISEDKNQIKKSTPICTFPGSYPPLYSIVVLFLIYTTRNYYSILYHENQ